MNGSFWLFMILALIFSVFGIGDKRRMFMLLRSMQLIINLYLFMIRLPGNVSLFYSVFTKIISFELSDYIIDWR